MVLESKIEVAINEAMAILAGLEVLRDTDSAVQPGVIEAVRDSTAKLISLLDEMSRGAN